MERILNEKILNLLVLGLCVFGLTACGEVGPEGPKGDQGIFNSLAGIAMHGFGPIDIVIFIFIILYQIGGGLIQFFTWRQQNIVLDSVEKVERM